MADIIKARARRGAIVQTAPVFEYDHGRRLAIYDTGLTAVTPIHWSYDLADGTAAVGLATYNSEEDYLTAAIPSSMLKYGRGIDYKLYAFVYVETEDEGLTVYRFAIPVTARPRPDEGVPSEKEATLIEQAITALGSFDIEAEETEDGCVVTITRPAGEKSVTIKGDKGDKGDAGVSPTATVTQTESGARVTITDASGTTTADISNGSKGDKGDKGDAGVSPTATVTGTASGARVTITDANGTTTANIYHGGTGSKGDKGDKGDAGVSPTATVTQTSSGATITITDAGGTTTANISNGSKGDTGATGPQGPAGATPVKGTDYFTPSDISDIVDDVIAALNNADTTGY